MAIGQAGIGIGIGMGIGIGIGMFRSSAAAGYDPCLTNFCTRGLDTWLSEARSRQIALGTRRSKPRTV